MKVLFLVQSCNKERYIKEEDIIRNSWGKRLHKNCDLYFYRGDNDKDVIKGDVLLLNCNDEVNETFRKTMRAFSVFKNNDYDFIIRTNTSLWVNVDLVLNSLETLDPNKRELIGGDCISNVGSYGIPFIRGNFIIFNRKMLSDLNESIKSGKCYVGIDDVCFAMNLLHYYNIIDVKYFNCLKTIPHCIYDETFDFKKISESDVCYVRCLEWIKERGDSTIIQKIDDEYQKQQKKIKPIKFSEIDTVVGKIFL